MRALIVVRLSRVTDATTSPERQLQACRELCAQRGYEVVGIAEDLDVSAASSPFDRPQLGDWLTNRLGEFDVLVFYRMDRIVRRLLDLADLIRWCQEHSVSVVSATEQFLDLTAPFGDIIALLVAKVAEMELAAIADRNANAFRHNFNAGRYRGGMPPWGYLPDDSTGEWRLVQDPEQVKVIREVARRVLAGETLRALAADLTTRRILTQSDRFAESRGRPIKGHGWHSGPLKRALTNQTLLGYAVTREPLTDGQGRVRRDQKGKKIFGPEKVVRNDDGSPLIRAEPILTREVFDQLGVELGQRENRKEPTKRSTALLLQVIFCGGPCSHKRTGYVCPDGCDGTCGQPAYRLKGGVGRKPRYRCASAQRRQQCGNGSVQLPEADAFVEDAFLGLLGESERLERVWDAGSDHSAELAEINDALTDLTSLLGTDVYRAGTPQRVKLDKRISDLAARQAALSSEAVKPAGWVWEGTGETFGAWWDRQDTEARNVWLRSMGVRLTFDNRDTSGVSWNLDLGDLDTLTQQLQADGPVVKWQRVLQTMEEHGVQGMTVEADGSITLTPKEV